MHFHLRPALPSDAAVLTNIYLTSFSNDAISHLVFPRSDPGSYKFWHDSINYEIHAPNSYFLCIVAQDPDQESVAGEEIIAYAKWNYVTVGEGGGDGDGEEELPEWPETADQAFGNYFFGTLDRKRREIMHPPARWKGYYYLELVATLPSYQGKGAAGMLIEWGLERADQMGVEAYLEASPVGKRIYERHGFKEVERFGVELRGKSWEGNLKETGDEEEYVEVFMVREAVRR
ncbi:hypothetical protein B7494_g5028 [Chlorociboria aeruginascens]|nr:hypothetical protein B7494_g5028 [Chlorociboria aeruginascens]